MSQKNPLINEINGVVIKYSNKRAVICYDNDLVIKELNYKDVGMISQRIQSGLDLFKNCFVGLYMDQNIFIPSIIIGLQSLQCPFTFLNATNTESFKNMDVIVTLNKEFDNSYYLFNKKIDLIWDYKLNAYISKDFRVRNKRGFIEKINYVVETSGTTGPSKQIWVEHYCIYSNIRDLRTKLNISHEDAIYYQTNITFDPSMIELYLSLTTGASLLIISNPLKRDFSKLFQILFKTGSITFLQMCPSTFLQWSQEEINYILNKSRLKVLLLGGEDFPKSLLTMVKNKNTKIFNIYGITEVSCWASIEEINFDREISLGETLNDISFEVRNENGIKIDEGEGELCIGSSKRICYLNKDEKISLPLFRRTGDLVSIKNGKIIYKCRLDSVFKRFGIKINLNQIEKEIFKLINLENIMVYLEEKSKLILFVKLNEIDESLMEKSCDKIRVQLLHGLKQEYFPDLIKGLSKIPLTKNGKVDKEYLKKFVDVVIKKNKNLSNELDIFKTLWVKYLPQNYDFNDKTFYELGGSSILRLQFTNEFKQLIHKKNQLPTQFFDYIFSNSYGKVINFIENHQFDKSLKNPMKKLKTLHHNYHQLIIKWSYDLKGCVDSTPCINKSKNLISIGSFSNNFATLNLTTGKELFKISLPNALESSSIITNSGNLVIIGCYDGCLYSMDMENKKILWCFRTEDKIKNKPVFIRNEEMVVFGSYDKHLYCLETKSGDVIWKILLKSPITADCLCLKEFNLLFIATINGKCNLVDFNGIILKQINLGNPIFSSPCLFNLNQIIIATVQEGIYCLNHRNDLEILWAHKLNTNIYSSLTTIKNLIFFTSHDGFLYSLEIMNNSSRLKFKIQLDSPSSSSVAIKEHLNEIYLITASIDGAIYVIDFYQESILIKYSLKAEIFSSPIIYQCKETNNLSFLIGCRDNKLYCIELIINGQKCN
ncbi:beta-alanine-activating enzyme [Onthophagus taurus]|uniref:beta-alanine-activating enzyme n=1 Tax=Onthophagus taurus TaxID=166361 RepID=UPI0039BE4AE4